MLAIGIPLYIKIERGPLDVIPVPHGILKSGVPGTSDRKGGRTDMHIRPSAIPVEFAVAIVIPIGLYALERKNYKPYGKQQAAD
jgi:hypothetical protein